MSLREQLTDADFAKFNIQHRPGPTSRLAPQYEFSVELAPVEPSFDDNPLVIPRGAWREMRAIGSRHGVSPAGDSLPPEMARKFADVLDAYQESIKNKDLRQLFEKVIKLCEQGRGIRAL
jgi:hypothetical protein